MLGLPRHGNNNHPSSGNRNLKALLLMTFLLLLPAALERKAEKVLSLFCKWREQDPEKLHDLPRARRHRHKIKKVSSDSSAIFPLRRPTKPQLNVQPAKKKPVTLHLENLHRWAPFGAKNMCLTCDCL